MVRGTADPSASLGMTKRRGSLKGRGPLPRARAVIGAVGSSISSPFSRKSKKVTTSWDDKKRATVYRE
jgi:hypothetical protein